MHLGKLRTLSGDRVLTQACNVQVGDLPSGVRRSAL